MYQIDYCKIVDSSYHYHNLYDYYYIYSFFFLCGSACGCVRQYENPSTLPHLLPSTYEVMYD